MRSINLYHKLYLVVCGVRALERAPVPALPVHLPGSLIPRPTAISTTPSMLRADFAPWTVRALTLPCTIRLRRDRAIDTLYILVFLDGDRFPRYRLMTPRWRANVAPCMVVTTGRLLKLGQVFNINTRGKLIVSRSKPVVVVMGMDADFTLCHS